MRQTAVEWYIENVKLKEIEYLDDKITTTQLDVIINNLGEQAKEMEKEQIIDAISNANKSNNRNVSLNSEQYYNETFKNK